jgi:hypothetical protein
VTQATLNGLTQVSGRLLQEADFQRAMANVLEIGEKPQDEGQREEDPNPYFEPQVIEKLSATYHFDKLNTVHFWVELTPIHSNF